MFTGIVPGARPRRRRRRRRHERRPARVAAPRPPPASRLGDSVAVDGVCLTVVDGRRRHARVRRRAGDARAHDARRSRRGDAVNVEPALRAGEPLGGHFVQGHVDGVGTRPLGRARGRRARALVDAPAELLRYCVEKGSIAVDGVSLTVAALDDAGFAVALVPHTLAATTLGALAPGDPVNLEVDVLAKYVERLLARVRMTRRRA